MGSGGREKRGAAMAGLNNRSSEHNSSSRWCLIESDPGVFTELVEKIGVRGVAFEEVFGLDEESFAAVRNRCPLQQNISPQQKQRKVFGFIFLYNWSKDQGGVAPTAVGAETRPAAAAAAAAERRQQLQQKTKEEGAGVEKREGEKVENLVESTPNCAALDMGVETDSQSASDVFPEGLFFAKQVITNACASQAILSVLINKREEIAGLGPTVESLVEFTKDFRDPHMRGEAIGNSETIRAAHNSFKSASPFDWTTDDSDKGQEDAFHFVSYLFFKGKAYEIDGLQDKPHCLGSCTEDSWYELVRKRVKQRVARIQGTASRELRFNLMAVVEDSLPKIQEELLRQRLVIQRANVKRISLGEDLELFDEVEDDATSPEAITIEDLPEDIQALKEVVRVAEEQKAFLKLQEMEEQQKRERWHKENVRRRHDFVPFILCILRHLARRGELVNAVTEAQRSSSRLQQERKKAKGSAVAVATTENGSV